MLADGGPYLAIAVLCERVLQEQDGVLSIIRIVDRIIQTAEGSDTPAKMPPVAVNLQAVLGFKAGQARGRHTARIRPEAPSGLRLGALDLDILFEGEERGSNLIVTLDFVAQEEGLWWIDVLLDDQMVTRMPLRISYRRVVRDTTSG